MTKLNVFIAAPYDNKEIAEALGQRITSDNITVVSRWHKPRSSSQNWEKASRQTRAKWATKDLNDLSHTDILIVLPDNDKLSRGGRMVEFGIFLALRKPILCVTTTNGKDEGNVYTQLPQIGHVEWKTDQIDDLSTEVNGWLSYHIV
jgi:nucleoside 2-deoxyribosyltransferase